MVTINIDPYEWDEKLSGISLVTALLQADKCLVNKRMDIKFTNEYICKNFVKDSGSFMLVPCLLNDKLVTFSYRTPNGVVMGFTVPIMSLHILLQNARKLRGDFDNVSKEQKE